MSLLSTQFRTFVHHMALDPSGSLMASCSSDKTVEVFHRKHIRGEGDVWVQGCTMRDHSGPVIRVAWCQHREHGPLLATAGADRWIYIYRITTSTHEGKAVTQAIRWPPVRGYEKDAIIDVAFVPPQQYHVLLLSTASLDGCVRLYEIHQPLQFPCVCKIMPELDYAAEVAASESASHAAGASTAGTAGSTSADACGNSFTSGSGAGGAGRLGPSASRAGAAMNPASVQAQSSLTRSGGITSIAWFPGSAESTMTLAVGSASGRFYLYRYQKETNTFSFMPIPASVGEVACRSPVEDVEWAPSVGRRFNLIAICSRTEVFVLRLNCISPSAEDSNITFELYRHPIGSVSAAWSRSATLLYLVMDDRRSRVTVLQMRNPMDHQSWVEVSQNFVRANPQDSSYH